MDAGLAAVLAGWGGGALGTVGAWLTARTALRSASAAHVHEVQDHLREKRATAFAAMVRGTWSALSRSQALSRSTPGTMFPDGPPSQAEITNVYDAYAVVEELRVLAADASIIADDATAREARLLLLEMENVAHATQNIVLQAAITLRNEQPRPESSQSPDSVRERIRQAEENVRAFEATARRLTVPDPAT
ncbi:hypothetical protein [Luteipulveratus mongoliensis]|uniref:Uncharacterized protein n=1 Tax=Luteipulveratus mongoliensis TaxID=571913 RepID=A0A0K1JLA4_9MICO|nr:hypothetical protein [Luteipulveratus mongoliensis]AKU17353.1 hypothetical protein VV02_18350 [Luteipulveratus mongoliensis]